MNLWLYSTWCWIMKNHAIGFLLWQYNQKLVKYKSQKWAKTVTVKGRNHVGLVRSNAKTAHYGKNTCKYELQYTINGALKSVWTCTLLLLWYFTKLCANVGVLVSEWNRFENNTNKNSNYYISKYSMIFSGCLYVCVCVW